MTTAPPRPTVVRPDDRASSGFARPAADTVVEAADGPGTPSPGATPPRPARRPRESRPRESRPRPVSEGRLPSVTRALGLSLTVLGVLLVVVALYVLAFAGFSEARAQQTLFKTFRGELSQAVAPTGPAPEGAPVAIVEAPTIGLRAVVVEGTASGDLLHGPGHRRDTPLPGQPGTSVLYGRKTLAGHPFVGLARLRPGDRIVVTTGQADAITFRVVGTRDSSAPVPAVTGTAPRLNLVTAASGMSPGHTLIVSAVLTSTPLDAAGARPAIGPAERALAVDGSALLTVTLWLQVLVLLTAATTALYVRGPRWTVYLISTPVLIAVVWNIAENLMRMLPNVV